MMPSTDELELPGNVQPFEKPKSCDEAAPSPSATKYKPRSTVSSAHTMAQSVGTLGAMKDRAQVRLRRKRRRENIEALRREMRLHPHLLQEEIQSLGEVFDTHAHENVSGVLCIDRAAVVAIMDENLVHLFNDIDTDHSGHLDHSEVGQLLAALGQNMNKAEFSELMLELDDDSSGVVDYAEFKCWWEERLYGTHENRERELADLFAAVDLDGSGEIDWEEFLEMISCAATTHCGPCVRTANFSFGMISVAL